MNKDGVRNCEKCEFPFPTKDDENRDLASLLAEIDEELDLEDYEEEEEDEDEEIRLPEDKSSLLPLRLASLAELRSVIQGVIDGKVPDEDLMDVIIDFQEQVDGIFERMDQMVFSPQMFKVMKKPYQATRKAFECYDNTFQELRRYNIDKDPEHLERGLELEEEANLYLSYAFNLVRETMTEMLGF